MKSEVWSLKSEVWGLKSEGVVFIILRKSFSVYSVWSVDYYHRNLDGIRRMVFGLRERKKSFVEIFNKMLLRKK